MKKWGKILAILLTFVCALSLLGCDVKPEQVKKSLEGKGYSVSETTLGKFTGMIAVKEKQSVTIIHFESEKDAEDSKKAIDALATIGGFSAVIHGNYIFYGTNDAVEVVKKIVK